MDLHISPSWPSFLLQHLTAQVAVRYENEPALQDKPQDQGLLQVQWWPARDALDVRPRDVRPPDVRPREMRLCGAQPLDVQPRDVQIHEM